MELTEHARKRIQERTQLLAQDVLSILEAGAAVKLGEKDSYRYFLFYDPKERKSKIAILNIFETQLISVWEKDFDLPAGIGKVTKNRIKVAYGLYSTFIFGRVTKNVPRTHEKRTVKKFSYPGEIEVMVDRRVVYTKKSSFVYSSFQSLSVTDLVTGLGEDFLKIVDEVKKLGDVTLKHVGYQVFLYDQQSTKSKFEIYLSHRRVLKILRNIANRKLRG